MYVSALQTAALGAGQIEEVAQRFGVDWPHLASQGISFAIVCLVLYKLAYRPVLKMLEVRRQQIALGVANAEKITAELARIEQERHAVVTKAGEEGKKLIEEARAAAARVRAEETEKAVAAAEQIVQRANEDTARERVKMVAELKQDFGRLVVRTTASVTGKILSAEDHRRLVDEAARQLAPSRDEAER